MIKQKFGFLLLSLSIVSSTFAQKKPLNHDVYDDWKSINSPKISESGNYIHYTISPQQGDALSILTTTDNNELLQIPRGYDLTLSDDERFLIALIKAPYQQTREAKIKKKKADEMPKD